MVCLLPSAAHCNSIHIQLLKAIGSTVLLSGLTVCVERMISGSQQDINSTTYLIYINPHICTVVKQVPAQEDSHDLYFHVMSKNCVVVTSQSRTRFTADVLMDDSLHTLRAEDGKDKTVQVALCFRDEAFKWYSYITNGGVYSLSSRGKLPSLTELSHSNYLHVTPDMQLKFVEHRPLAQTVCNSADLKDKDTLPGFLEESKTEKSVNKRYYTTPPLSCCSLCYCMAAWSWSH